MFKKKSHLYPKNLKNRLSGSLSIIRSGLFVLVALQPLNAMSIRTAPHVETTDNDLNEEEDNVDIWFGPGFYYGIWFDNEADYWQWRSNHRHYPSNHNYYHHDHPIHYHQNAPHGHGGHGNGGGHRGGGHGGGGRR